MSTSAKRQLPVCTTQSKIKGLVLASLGGKGLINFNTQKNVLMKELEFGISLFLLRDIQPTGPLQFLKKICNMKQNISMYLPEMHRNHLSFH